MKKRISELKEKYQDTEMYLGVRFDSRFFKIGDFLPISKSNRDREDSREFPEFGSEDYNSLPDLSGTSAYDVDYWENHIDVEDCKLEGLHLYVIAGDDYMEGEDYDEMVIRDAQVIAILL